MEEVGQVCGGRAEVPKEVEELQGRRMSRTRTAEQSPPSGPGGWDGEGT